MDKSTVRERGAVTLTNLYRSAVSDKILFKALRGSDMVWEAIVANATMFEEIEIVEAKELLAVMSMARREYIGNAATELTQLADQYIALRKETLRLGPP